MCQKGKSPSEGTKNGHLLIDTIADDAVRPELNHLVGLMRPGLRRYRAKRRASSRYLMATISKSPSLRVTLIPTSWEYRSSTRSATASPTRRFLIVTQFSDSGSLGRLNRI